MVLRPRHSCTDTLSIELRDSKTTDVPIIHHIGTKTFLSGRNEILASAEAWSITTKPINTGTTFAKFSSAKFQLKNKQGSSRRVTKLTIYKWRTYGTGGLTFQFSNLRLNADHVRPSAAVESLQLNRLLARSSLLGK